MAASGFTPLQTYYSSTATTAPLAANLAYGELAINITDGKLYYKDNTNVVRVIASTAGSSGSFTNIVASGSITAGTNFIGPGTGLTGTATTLSIGGTAALATSLVGGVAGVVGGAAAEAVSRVRNGRRGPRPCLGTLVLPISWHRTFARLPQEPRAEQDEGTP